MVYRAADKLFQMTGPVTAKLLIPSMVIVLGTDSNLVPAMMMMTTMTMTMMMTM